MTDSFESLNEKLVNPLTQREFETLQLTFSNQTNKQIAEQLFVSVNTVKTHLRNVYDKFGVTNRKEAMAKALRSKN